MSATPPGGSAASWAYTGDTQNERVEAGSDSFTYNSLGLGIQTNSGGSTYYIRDANGKLVEERTPGGSYYYLFDGLGSVTALTNSSGGVAASYKYDPYGQITSSTGTVANPWRFAGGYYDTSLKLYKFGQRYYDPSIARWTQQDPQLHIGDPLQQDRYTYSGDDPVNYTDPSGTCNVFEAASIAIALALAGVALLAAIAALPEITIPAVLGLDEFWLWLSTDLAWIGCYLGG